MPEYNLLKLKIKQKKVNSVNIYINIFQDKSQQRKEKIGFN